MSIVNSAKKANRKVEPVRTISRLSQHSEPWHREFKYWCRVHSTKKAVDCKHSQPNETEENAGTYNTNMKEKGEPGRNIDIYV